MLSENTIQFSLIPTPRGSTCISTFEAELGRLNRKRSSWIHFPGLRKQRTTNQMAENNRNALSPSSGGWKSKVKVFADCVPPGSRGGPCLPLPLLVTAGGLGLPLSDLCLPVCVFLYMTPYRELVIGLRAPLPQCGLLLANPTCRTYFKTKFHSEASDGPGLWEAVFPSSAATAGRQACP